MQCITNDVDGSIRFSEYTVEDRQEALKATRLSQESLNVFVVPNLSADLISLKGGDQLVFLVAHHLVVDLVSWRIILEDLEECLRSGSLSIPASMSFQTWSQMQASFTKENLPPWTVLPLVDMPDIELGFWKVSDVDMTQGDGINEDFSLSLNSPRLCSEHVMIDSSVSYRNYLWQPSYRHFGTSFTSGNDQQCSPRGMAGSNFYLMQMFLGLWAGSLPLVLSLHLFTKLCYWTR